MHLNLHEVHAHADDNGTILSPPRTSPAPAEINNYPRILVVVIVAGVGVTRGEQNVVPACFGEISSTASVTVMRRPSTPTDDDELCDASTVLLLLLGATDAVA